MKRSIFTIAFLSCLCATLLKAQIPTELSNRLQTVLDSVCTKYHIKGTSAAVLIPDIGIWKGTYGESYEGNPIRSDMLLGMGSNTKIHMSSLLLKLQEDGLVDLDDTIGAWIHNKPNISGQITIRQCLNHTSGLFDYLQNDAINDSVFGHPSKIWDMEEILGLAEAPNFAPGTSWDYSNTNYIIAGIIIQELLNKPIANALQDSILIPNGLNNTFFYGMQPNNLEVAHPWSKVLSGSQEDMTLTPYLNNLFSMASTAGALITTAEDNVQFWYKIISGQIINNSSLNEMRDYINLGGTTNHKIGYGLGIFRYQNYMNGHTIYTHGGTFFGFINENMVDSITGTAVSALTNQDSISNDIILTKVIGALHKVTLQMGYTAVENITDNAANIKLYPNPANNTITIQTDNSEHLLLHIFDMMGKQQMSEEIKDHETTLNIEHLQPGFYFASLQNANGQFIRTQKIQIVR